MYNEFMIEFCKEKISYYKLLLTFSITAIYGIVGWYFGRSTEFSNIIKMAAVFVFIAIIMSIATIVYKIRFYTDKLREEE